MELLLLVFLIVRQTEYYLCLDESIHKLTWLI